MTGIEEMFQDLAEEAHYRYETRVEAFALRRCARGKDAYRRAVATPAGRSAYREATRLRGQKWRATRTPEQAAKRREQTRERMRRLRAARKVERETLQAR